MENSSLISLRTNFFFHTIEFSYSQRKKDAVHLPYNEYIVAVGRYLTCIGNSNNFNKIQSC